MAAKRGELVPRFPKKTEYAIRFATANASKGWQGPRRVDPQPTRRRLGLPDAYPTAEDADQLPLRGELSTVNHGGKTHERWQHKPTPQGDARIWFYVSERTAYPEQVHTRHPNETK